MTDQEKELAKRIFQTTYPDASIEFSEPRPGTGNPVTVTLCVGGDSRIVPCHPLQNESMFRYLERLKKQLSIMSVDGWTEPMRLAIGRSPSGRPGTVMVEVKAKYADAIREIARIIEACDAEAGN